MKRNNSEAAVYTESVEVQESSSIEVDLYAQLTAFEELTPEEQAPPPVYPEIKAAEENPEENPAEENPAEEVAQSNENEFEAAQMFFGRSISEPVESDASDPEMDSAAAAQSDVEEGPQATDAGSDVFVKPGGPLENLESLDGGIEFTGALSSGVCLACGAESSTEDLFCLACGVFIEDIS
jgi:hypothetical protein